MFVHAVPPTYVVAVSLNRVFLRKPVDSTLVASIADTGTVGTAYLICLHVVVQLIKVCVGLCEEWLPPVGITE